MESWSPKFAKNWQMDMEEGRCTTLAGSLVTTATVVVVASTSTSTSSSTSSPSPSSPLGTQRPPRQWCPGEQVVPCRAAALGDLGGSKVEVGLKIFGISRCRLRQRLRFRFRMRLSWTD